MNQIKQSTATYPITFLMVDSTDHVTGKTGLTPTVTLSKNGGAFASPTGAVSEIGSGWYKVAANATDSNTLGPLLLNATATGADPTDVKYEIVSHDPFGLSTPLDAAGTRSALGMASANLDTQLAAIQPLTAAGTRSALGMASANLDTQISAIPASTRTALGMASANLDTQLAAIPNANANADALLDRSNAIWTGWTVRKVLRVMASALAGKLTGANTSTKRFRDFLDTKDVIVATTAVTGRTSVTLDGS